ncbi:MAG: PIN domain-containing protein [Candidatus Thorarchaeota archaeon]
MSPVDWIKEDCKEYWNDAIRFLGPDLEEHLRMFLSEFGSILSSSTGFKIRVVVDTNVVISEMRRLMSGKAPFLSKLTCSPFLETISPSEMIQELTEKIRELHKSPEEQKSAFEHARTIVKGIQVVRGFQVNTKIRAAALMEEKDPEDVVFVQIAMERDTHGVITKDKHFLNLEGIKQWELGEVGRVLTEVNRGALTLWVAARGIPLAVFVLIKLGMMLVSMGFSALTQLISAGVKLGETALKRIIDTAKANPLLAIGALLGITLVSVFLYTWEPSRKAIDTVVESGKSAIENLISGVAVATNQLHEAIQLLVEAAKDQLPILLDWIECLTSSIMLLFRRIEELEQTKA